MLAYEMVKVQDIMPGDRIYIDEYGQLLRSPITVEYLDTARCKNHTHINNACYDNGLELGIYATGIRTK